MLRTVLVPLDGSELAEGILTQVSPLLVDDPDARLELLRVVEDAARPAEEDAEDAAQRYLEAVQTRLAGDGRKAGLRIVRGDPAGGILARVAEGGLDLVALATHGRTGLERFVRGSVAERVLRGCSLPLLLVNPHGLGEGQRIERILVPLDGSELSNRVIPYALALGQTLKAKLTLLRVEPFVPVTVPSPILAPGWNPAQVEATLEPQAERLRSAGLEVEVRARIGIEAVEILEAAQEADLVAMATHGRSGLSRWWFGSVAEQVLRECARPLLLVPAREATATG